MRLPHAPPVTSIHPYVPSSLLPSNIVMNGRTGVHTCTYIHPFVVHCQARSRQFTRPLLPSPRLLCASCAPPSTLHCHTTHDFFIATSVSSAAKCNMGMDLRIELSILSSHAPLDHRPRSVRDMDRPGGLQMPAAGLPSDPLRLIAREFLAPRPTAVFSAARVAKGLRVEDGSADDDTEPRTLLCSS